MRLLYDRDGIQVYHGDSLTGLPCEVDHIITDPPYSERTHKQGDHIGITDNSERRWLAGAYPSWGEQSVSSAVYFWQHNTKGWICVLTDHLLARAWENHLYTHRYVFAPLPFYSPGSRVRLAGDGPSSWTCWIVVARPRHKPYSSWGTLPGGYVHKPEKMPLVGGKPLPLMMDLVRDYSRPGDLVCDPCCGAGTTLLAAKALGRRAVGIDISEEHCEMTIKRLERPVQTSLLEALSP